MATEIKYLSIDITLGGYELVLETDDTKTIAELPDSGDIKDKINEALGKGVSFRMKRGEVITVTVKEFIDWASAKIDATLNTKLTNFFQKATASNGSTLDAIIIDVWNVAITLNKPGNTLNLDFEFFIRVNLDNAFYTGIFGSDPKITDIIKINSVGFGMRYSNNP